jgi:hypothetical protein
MLSSRLMGHADKALPQITTHIFNYLNYFEKLAWIQIISA